MTKVEILLPQHTFNAVHDKLIRGGTAPTFKRVVMSLSDMVTGPFYEKYLKQGTQLLRSVLVLIPSADQATPQETQSCSPRAG